MFTCPLLLQALSSICVWTADVFANELALLNVPTLFSGTPSVELRFHCAPSWLFSTAPLKNRSEERRVGKECGSRWVRQYWIKKPVRMVVALVGSTAGRQPIWTPDQLSP